MLWDKEIEQIIHDINYRLKSTERHPRGPLAADAARRARTINGRLTISIPPSRYRPDQAGQARGR